MTTRGDNQVISLTSNKNPKRPVFRVKPLFSLNFHRHSVNGAASQNDQYLLSPNHIASLLSAQLGRIRKAQVANTFFLFVFAFVEWVKFKLVPRAFSLAFPLPTSFPAPKQRKSSWERSWQKSRLYFRCCLESGPCSSPRIFRERSAGSFSEQRLVTELSKTLAAIV